MNLLVNSRTVKKNVSKEMWTAPEEIYPRLTSELHMLV